MISIIIPAHNEAAVIGRCLRSLLAGVAQGELEIIVACNGCSDDTAAIARQFGEPTTVIETPVASKTEALNLGDAAARGFPRFYVDADVVVSLQAIRIVADVLRSGCALAAAPIMRIRLDCCSWAVRAYYLIWTRLPYYTGGPLGGCYGLTQEGRQRVGRYPDIVSDDGFVRLHFREGERKTVEGCSFDVLPPRNLGELLRIKTRSQFGKYELYRRYPELRANDPRDYRRALWEVCCQPRLWPCLVVYLFVLSVTRAKSLKRLLAGRHRTWDRDDSSRQPELSVAAGQAAQAPRGARRPSIAAHRAPRGLRPTAPAPSRAIAKVSAMSPSSMSLTDTRLTMNAQSPRAVNVAAGDAALEQLLIRLMRVSVSGLARMYLPSQRRFAFARRRTPSGMPLTVGESVRYSAISLLGISCIDETAQRFILHGQTAREYAAHLLDDLAAVQNLGDAALLAWAAANVRPPRSLHAFEHLRRQLAGARSPLTVEVAWALSALLAADGSADVIPDVRRARELLLQALSSSSGLFAHHVVPRAAPWHRAHVGSFADQVYPIQALARHARVCGNRESLDLAARAAAQICRLQGTAGQWWWHYDVRTGDVLEGYPIYTVHQDSMAPMALLDLKESGGPDLTASVRRGLTWLLSPEEMDTDPIDDEQAVIWRSVRRTGPVKVVRALRALASRHIPGWRLRWLDRVFPPTAVDYEDRPYHLGWILFAWLSHL